MLRYWRRLDVEGLERVEILPAERGYLVSGVLVCVEDGGFVLEHRWRLTEQWQTITLELRLDGATGRVERRLERSGEDWLVDGSPQPGLRGAEEPDVSATPFCNTLPVRRLDTSPGSALTLNTCYVDATTLSVVRSTQRYERLDERRVRYVDLGTAAGFTAVLEIDPDGLVERYEGLFERVDG